GPPHHRRVAVLVGPGGDRLFEGRGGVDEQRGGPGEGDGQGGVDHVGGGEPVVDPAPGRWTDAPRHDVDEGRHVVVGDPLPGLDGGHVVGGDMPAVRSRMVATSAAGTV